MAGNASSSDGSLQDHQGMWVLLTGLGIGWLGGMSVAPVASTVLSSLLGLAVGVVTGLQALRKAKGDSSLPTTIDARPVAFLTVGIAMGASAGIVSRTHAWLAPGPPPASESEATGSESELASGAALGVLFTNTATACEEVLNAQDGPAEEFRRTFRAHFEDAARLEDEVEDTEQLIRLIRILCDTT